VPVGEILPGEGVVLEDGTRISARTVVCNVDPKVALRLLDDSAVPADYRERLEAWKVRSPVVKFNAALTQKPSWAAAPGETWTHFATVDVTHGMDACQRAFEACDRGEPAIGFGEIYLQTGYDPSPAPEGYELLSVFGQYGPYELAEGDWDSRRDEVAEQFISLIETFAPGFRDTIAHHEVLGPPHIEQRVGLTGGNIFQGAMTPGQLFSLRPVLGYAGYRTPVKGLYLCGAAAHPGGGVMGAPGRNAAREILRGRRYRFLTT
jgi:phytoene dehydrogenase-like protein